MPWDMLLLFGGGLTLAGQLAEAGVLSAVADALASMPSLSPAWLIAGFVLMSLFLTEVMSNLALTVVMVPVVAQVAMAWGMNPLLLVVPVTMASSCAFMLPMATPPNAIVFGSGKLRMATMVQVGVVLNVVAAGLAWLWAMTVLPWWVQLL
jgi:sodium-dependent dicarboxylate transporter 2/3/5